MKKPFRFLGLVGFIASLMKNYTVIISLFFISLFWGCKPAEDKNNVRIEVNSAMKRKEQILLFKPNVLSGSIDTIAFVISDSLGKAMFNFKLPTPIFAYFLINNRYQPLYLSPNDNLQLTLDSNNTSSFKGVGAEVANYLVQNNSIRETFDMTGGKYFFQLEPIAFLSRLDSLQGAFSKFHSGYLDSINISKNVAVILAKRNDMQLLSQLQNYAAILKSNAADTNLLPERLKNIDEKIPLDDSLIEMGIPQYFDILRTYLSSKFENPFYINKRKKEISEVNKRLSILTDNAIRKQNFSKRIKESLLSINISKNLDMEGITPALDTVYSNFKIEFPNSFNLPAIEKNYDNWLSLSKGKPAPDFIGTTQTGEQISLSSLKGKIVYIDVWATWCVPCVEEIPYGKKIKPQFEGNDEVVFLYVSVDYDVKAWKKYLKKDPQFKGLHINLTEKQNASISKSYQMWGIPQFMLIDQAGKIVSVKAARPSSGKVTGEIQRLLVL